MQVNSSIASKHTALFRLADFPTVIICTEPFKEAVQRLDLGEINFRNVPVQESLTTDPTG